MDQEEIKRRRTLSRTKVTPEMVDKIKMLKAADLKYREISYVIERDYDMKLTVSLISDIVNGHKHTGKGSVTDEDMEYISKLIDGEEKGKELPRLEKFGIAWMYHKKTIKETIEHYDYSKGIELTEDRVLDIVSEIDKIIESGNLRNEDERWFAQLIKE